jgi:hypothetical protein
MAKEREKEKIHYRLNPYYSSHMRLEALPEKFEISLAKATGIFRYQKSCDKVSLPWRYHR